MRFSWTFVAVAGVLFVLPFSAVYSSYFIFNLYATAVDRGRASSHVTAASHSILLVANAILCLVSPLSFVPLACPRPSETNGRDTGFALQQIIGSQRILADELVHYMPSIGMFATIQSFESAAAAILDPEQSPAPPSKGSHKALILSDIRMLSRKTVTSLHGVLSHVETALARIAFIQTTILTGLALLDSADSLTSRIFSPKNLQFHGVNSLAFNATLDSVSRTLQEVDTAVTFTSSLSTAVALFSQDSDAARRCSSSSDVLCEPLSPLVNNWRLLSSILEDLAEFKVVLQGTYEEMAHDMPSAVYIPAFPYQVVQATIDAQIYHLRQKLAVVRLVGWAVDSGNSIG